MAASAKKSQAKVSQKRSSKTPQNPLDMDLPSILSQVRESSKTPAGNTGYLYVLGLEDKNRLSLWIDQWAPQFQKAQLKKVSKEVLQFTSDQGPIWILSPKKRGGPFSHQGRLEDSTYSWMRDQVGSLLGFFKAYHLDHVHIELHSTDEEQELGLFSALEMAAYQYRAVIEGRGLAEFPKVTFRKFGGPLEDGIIKKAQALGGAVNLARHLVNTPPNFINPVTYAQFVSRQFSKRKNIRVEIWDEKRLQKENMNLLLGVGQGSAAPPRLVHLSYRPRGGSKKRPIAFVGKGITFDTGGLDIKPSAGMRMMKKDMGGSASVLALAQWASEANYPRALDFYLALAENSVDSRSFRPSDVLTARNGMKVEIHNTDAEGRLVLADALDVASSKKGMDEPEVIIDVATLTGAIKVALGSELAGLFSNDDQLAEALSIAGQRAGDLNWRMPLYSRYTSQMSSAFADIVNAVDGFGGAITAALFLEKFIRQKSWAHLDIYAWNDKATGPFGFAGGNGQAVQCLIRYLISQKN
ncbi:MAG: leucyl aminopeptidase family protein [Pseudobdellovibrionaceae bacterium]